MSTIPKISLILTCLITAQTSSVDAAEMIAGTSRIDITPPRHMKAALGGYGARMSQPAQGVHDPVFVKAIVLSDGSRRFAVLTADLLGFPPTFKPMLTRQLAPNGWQSSQILLLPSHSHTSIEMNAINSANTFGIKQIGIFDEALLQWTINKCGQAIVAASENLTAVNAGTASIQLPGWNRNRRRRDGFVDDTLTITRIDKVSGDPLAVLVNFTAHPTFMGPEHMLFSGGWPGHLQKTLERMIGHDVNVLYYNGAEGDQAPVGRPEAAADRWLAAEQYGKAVAEQAHGVWQKLSQVLPVDFDFHSQRIELPQTTWHPDFMQTGGAEYGLSEDQLRKMLPIMFPRQTVSGSLRLGNLIIVGVPGEMTADLGKQIKDQVSAATNVPYVTIGGLANEWISYILSAAEYKRGGYEASVSFYGSQLGDTVVQGAVNGASKLKAN